MNIVQSFQEQLAANQVLIGAAVSERYPHIWKMQDSLQAKAVILPQSTEDVSKILAICYQHRQPIVVHGGLTNLVGSTESSMNEVVISMEKMDAIEEIDESSRTLTVQAGAILENVQNAAEQKNLLFPINFGAKGSAQIGGMISTNAGGLRVFRYGMTRNLVLGLEAVLADGTVISSMKKIIKDNSGYDLKQLFIGTEGTLGVVTKAVFKLVERPKSRNSALVALEDFDKVVAFLKYMDRGMTGSLSGFELFWNITYKTLTGPAANVKPPMESHYPYYVLLESLGANQKRDQDILIDLLAEALEHKLILEAIPANTTTELEWFWGIRENVDALISLCKHDQHFDISLPIKHVGSVVNNIVNDLRSLSEVQHVFPFGHVADGNIHLVVGKSNASETLTEQVNEIVYAPLTNLGGSISAEHGIGVHKKPYLNRSRNPQEIQLMKTLKIALDPKGILNQGIILD